MLVDRGRATNLCATIRKNDSATLLETHTFFLAHIVTAYVYKLCKQWIAERCETIFFIALLDHMPTQQLA